MATEAFTVHGGRLAEARARFPGAPLPWIDLSTGVNPLPYPAAPADVDARARLPDPEEIGALEAVAAGAFGVAADSVLATAGAEAAIRLLTSVLPARQVAILEPTYGGHAEAWRAAGAAVFGVERSNRDRLIDDFDALIVTNPNNPDGAALPVDALVDLGAGAIAKDGWLIVDEAFIEASDADSLIPRLNSQIGADGLIVLRSFGKFYGLPGVRLGFVAARPQIIALLRRRLGAWPVSADAIAAGRQAYADRTWAKQTRGRLSRQTGRLDALLERSGLRVIGGTSLFRLTESEDAQTRFVRLAEAGVLTRPFDYAPQWLRFGLPAPEHWPRVEAALMESGR